MEEFVAIVAIGGFFGTVITFIYMYFKSRHAQRMALIESGQSAEIFNVRKLDNKYAALKYGMLLTGLGIGFFVGVIVESALHWPDALAVLPLSVIGGGLGLVGFYLIMANKNE